MKKIKVAVVGVGYLGKEHARIYSELPHAELIGVVDINSERAQEIAGLYRTKAFTDLDNIINDTDALSIAVPTDKHFEVAKELINAGKSVLIEKPITSNLKEGRNLVNLAKRKSVLLQVGHIERFNPIIKSLAESIKNPRFIEIHRLSPFTPRGTEVSVVLDLMIHDIDIVLALVKESIKSIDAIGVSVLTGHEDIANARVVFKNGCVANLTASRVSAERMRKIRIFEPNSYTSVDYYKQEGVCYYKSGSNILKKPVMAGRAEPLKLELEDFVNCVMTGRTPLVTGEDALMALGVAENIKQKIWKLQS